MSDKESLIKQDALENVKSEPGGHLVVNSIPKIDSGASSESTSDSTSDFKSKTEKTKSKNENNKVVKKTLDQTKKEKNSLNIKVKDDLDKNKEKSKIEKDKINDESDDSKEKKRRLKGKNGNPFLRIIGEMTDEKSDEDKQFENDSNSNLTKHLSRRKQNLKNLSSGEKMKLKLSNESKKSGRNLNSTSDSKKEPRPLPPPAPKLKLPESKTILEKKNYSINIEKKEFVGEKKPTVKTFKSKFRSTGLEEQPPPPPSKSQSKKSTKNLTPLSLSKAEKRSLSPPSSDTPVEKKPKNSPTDTKKPRKILNLCTIFNFLNEQNYYSVSANYKFLTHNNYKTRLSN